jgi:hypothetical protein
MLLLLCHVSVASRALYIDDWTMELNWRLSSITLDRLRSFPFLWFLSFHPCIWVISRVVAAYANPIYVWCKASVWQLWGDPNLMGHIYSLLILVCFFLLQCLRGQWFCWATLLNAFFLSEATEWKSPNEISTFWMIEMHKLGYQCHTCITWLAVRLDKIHPKGRHTD